MNLQKISTAIDAASDMETALINLRNAVKAYEAACDAAKCSEDVEDAWNALQIEKYTAFSVLSGIADSIEPVMDEIDG